jgi:uncharacterized protein (DUF58 family)
VTTVAPTFDELFDPLFLDRVGTFSLRAREAQKGGRLADQRTSARGQGSDFADFKPYVAGDDLRAIDWNIYRRLGRAFVRVFEERQDLPVYFLVDVSRSMFVEETPRIGAALRATLALAATALEQHDSVTLLPFSDDVAMRLRAVSGRARIAQVARALADCRPEGRTGLAAAVTRLGTMKLRRGLVVIVSDFFDDDGLDAVVAALGRLRHRVLLLRIARAADADPTLDPAIAGDLLVDDGEREEPLSLTITPELIARYRAAYAEFDAQLSGFADANGVGMVSIDADRDVLDQLAPMFASRGVVL